MLRKIKNTLVGLAVAATGVVVPVMAAQPVMATGGNCPSGTVRAGQWVNNLSECTVKEDNSLMPTLQVIINVAISVLGLVAVIMIIIGGFNYMTSQGDATKTAKARNTILYGVIGLIVALLAFAIVNFVLKGVFGSGN